MHHQGMSVNLIASNLGVSAAVVDGYLRIAISSGAAPTAAPSGGSNGSATASEVPSESVSSAAKPTPSK
jgi:transposase